MRRTTFKMTARRWAFMGTGDDTEVGPFPGLQRANLGTEPQGVGALEGEQANRVLGCEVREPHRIPPFGEEVERVDTRHGVGAEPQAETTRAIRGEGRGPVPVAPVGAGADRDRRPGGREALDIFGVGLHRVDREQVGAEHAQTIEELNRRRCGLRERNPARAPCVRERPAAQAHQVRLRVRLGDMDGEGKPLAPGIGRDPRVENPAYGVRGMGRDTDSDRGRRVPCQAFDPGLELHQRRPCLVGVWSEHLLVDDSPTTELAERPGNGPAITRVRHGRRAETPGLTDPLSGGGVESVRRGVRLGPADVLDPGEEVGLGDRAAELGELEMRVGVHQSGKDYGVRDRHALGVVGRWDCALGPHGGDPAAGVHQDGSVCDRRGGDRPEEASRHAQRQWRSPRPPAAGGRAETPRENGEWTGQYSVGSVPGIYHSQ